MSKEEIFKICDNMSAEELSVNYSKAQLTAMYTCLYGIPLCGNKSKLDIAYSIWQFVADEKRTADLCKLLC